jgi:hypothetical protein
MQTSTFFIQLIITTLIAGLALFVPSYVSTVWSYHKGFSVSIVLTFVLLSSFLFFLGKVTAKNSDKYLFHGVIMASVFIKLIVGLGALFMYSRNYTPINNYYIWIFLITYLIFTIWEVSFMTKLAKTK